MFTEDPLSPAASYWKNFGMPGIGLFLEGYVVSTALAVLYNLQQHWCELLHAALPFVSGEHMPESTLPNLRWNKAFHLVLLCCLQIFSISNNSTLFKQAYPRCWSKFTDCNKVSLHTRTVAHA